MGGQPMKNHPLNSTHWAYDAGVLQLVEESFQL